MVDETWGRAEPEGTISQDATFGGVLKPCERRTHTHETVKDVTLQEATESTEDRETRRGTSRSRRAHEAHRESAQQGQGLRDAKKAKEEAVKYVAESMHECKQHERVLRSEQDAAV